MYKKVHTNKESVKWEKDYSAQDFLLTGSHTHTLAPVRSRFAVLLTRRILSPLSWCLHSCVSVSFYSNVYDLV